MKRLICLLFALCLPACALAETIAERIGAPERWQGEYQSNTGKTRIVLDMVIQVPEVEAVPIWAVEPRTFTVEEIVHAADVFLGEGNWRQVTEENWPFSTVEGEPRYLISNDTVDWITEYYCNLVTGDALEEARSVSGRYTLQKGGGDWHWTNSLGYGKMGIHWGRNLPTEEEALRMADEAVRAIAPEMVLESRHPELGLEVGEGRGRDAKGHTDYGYRFYYQRVLDGIPVTVVQQSGAGGASASMELLEFNPVLYYETLSVDVGEDGIFGLGWGHPITVTEKIAEDCELLPFETILDVLGTVGVLKYQHFESGGSTVLNIDRAVLGYMCLQERGKPTSYRMVPVWDFFGTRDYHNDHEVIYNESYLTINAIDGTIIDRVLGY